MSLKTIIKRDNTTELFDINKIEKVLNIAFGNTNTICNNMSEILNYINGELIKKNEDCYKIEDIQDLVENTLMIYKYYETAKHYIHYRDNKTKTRNESSYLSKIPDDIITPWGMLGYITYKRTYARRLYENDDNNDDETTEEFRDTIIRILDGCQSQLHVNFTNNELKQAYKYLMSLKCSVAGRFLWQLGTKNVSKLGIMSLQNCAFVKIDEPIKPFLWIFDVLMLGTGVGFSIQRENVDKLPPILDTEITITRLDTKDADFIVPDSREGWGSLFEKIFEAYFYKGKSFSYSTVLIRSAGTKIKGFGGVASGPEDLVKGIKNIQGILNKRRGTKLTGVDCLDIVNIIASIVVAGNVRRCLPKGSKVHTKNGLINIEDIIVGDEVLTTYGYKKVANRFAQGIQPVFTITTTKGTFTCTKNHKMAVLNGNDYIWMEAGNLKNNNTLILTREPIKGSNNIVLPSIEYTSRRDRLTAPNFTEEIAWLFGYLVSGAIHTKPALKIMCRDYKQLKKISKIIKKFGDTISLTTTIDKINNIYSIDITAFNFINYINNHIKSNTIPYFINETTLNNRFAYIAGVIDGFHTKYEDVITINSSSEIYINDLNNVLYSCGLECKKNKTNLIINDIQSLKLISETQYLDSQVKINSEKITNIIQINNIVCSTAEIVEMKYLNDHETYDIEVEEVHEFFCNGYLTHNSALICLGDYDDIEYLNAKRWDMGNIPNWRCMSNNSVVCSDTNKLPEEFWEGYKGNGEPYGLINIDLSRKIGRIKDGEKYPDPLVEGFNPCAEQSLANYETCCLSEIFLCNIKSYDELKEIATILYRICKHSLLLKCHQEETEKIVHKNMRMGIGITGYLQSTNEQKSWLSDLYEYLRDYDKFYSNKIGVDTSVKLTTIKPSGTLSLLSGVCSGAHPGIYQYFIRRIRIASSNTQLINLAKKNNFFIEYQRNFDGTDDKNTQIIEFPCRYPEGTVLAKDMTAIDQLNVVKELQTNWSDNAVSVTVYYRLEELDTIKEWLCNNYTNNVKSCSFLLHNEHGFKQAPFEEITKEKYEELIKKVIPITSGNIKAQTDNELTSECVGGACPVR
jgi:ribonucleotide reductase alpha subunit